MPISTRSKAPSPAFWAASFPQRHAVERRRPGRRYREHPARGGGPHPTQLKVLLAVLDGQLNKQIAFQLGITESTVKAHMTAIMRKLDVRNRTQAALVARSLGLDLAH
jgi:DNA-binding NarL/FixJ family response regulator